MDNISQQMGSISLTSTTLTLCSWNVQQLSENSKKRPEKFQAVVDTIRGLNCDVIALQEVSTETAGEILANLLNTTPNEWSAQSYVVYAVEGELFKEHSVFLWKNTSISDVRSRDYGDNSFNRRLHCIDFEYNAKSMTAINFHFKARGAQQKVANDQEQDALYNFFQNGPKDLIAVGDFNCYPMSFSPQGQMMTNYSQLLHPRMYTNTIEDDCYDNVLVRPDVKKKHNPVASVCDICMDSLDSSHTSDDISNHKPIKVIFSNM